MNPYKLRQIINGQLKLPQFRLQKTYLSLQSVEYISKNLSQQCYRITMVRVSLTSAGVLHLAQSSIINLQYLFLNDNLIGNKGCKYLTTAKWEHLHYLCLNQNNINNAEVNHLSKGRWKKLKEFVIMGNCLTDNSVKLITKGDYIGIYNISLTNKFMKGVTNIQKVANLHTIMALVLSPWQNQGYVNLYDKSRERWEIVYLKKVLLDKSPDCVAMLT